MYISDFSVPFNKNCASRSISVANLDKLQVLIIKNVIREILFNVKVIDIVAQLIKKLLRKKKVCTKFWVSLKSVKIGGPSV